MALFVVSPEMEPVNGAVRLWSILSVPLAPAANVTFSESAAPNSKLPLFCSVKEPVPVIAVLKIAFVLFCTVTEPDPLIGPLKVTLAAFDMVIDPWLVIDSASARVPVYDCDTSRVPPFAMEIELAVRLPPASAKRPALMVNAPLGLLGPPELVMESEPPVLSDTVAP